MSTNKCKTELYDVHQEDPSNLHLAWEMLKLAAVVFAKTRFANLRAKTELSDRPKKEVQKLETLITHLMELPIKKCSLIMDFFQKGMTPPDFWSFWGTFL